MKKKNIQPYLYTMSREEAYKHKTLSKDQKFDRDIARGHLTQAVSALAFCVSRNDLMAKTRRTARIAFARQAAMYLTHIAYGLSLSRVGRIFGRDRSTASHACHRMEDLRDDPVLDARFEDLEAYLRSAPDILKCEESNLVRLP